MQKLYFPLLISPRAKARAWGRFAPSVLRTQRAGRIRLCLLYSLYLRPKDARREATPRSGFSPWRNQKRKTLAILLAASFAPLLLSAGCHKPDSAASDKGGDAKAGAGADAADKSDKSADKADDKSADALPPVQVATARTGTIEETLPLTGTLTVPRDAEATIGAPVSGVIDALPVRFGQAVARGTVVLQLSTAALRGQIDQARATIAQDEIQVQQAELAARLQIAQSRGAILQAQSSASGARAGVLAAQATLTGDLAAVTNAEQNLTRLQTLQGEGLVATKDVEAARLTLQTAQAQVAAQRQTIAAQGQTLVGQQQAVGAAQAATIQNTVKQKDIAITRQQLANAQGALATALAQRALYTVRAPISGTVTAVNASLGESVDPTIKVLTIADLGRLQLQIAVPSASANAVHVGQAVQFRVDAIPGHTFQATVRTVGAQVDPATSTIVALADAVNTGHRLKDDMTARVGLVTARHANAVLVPRAAVFVDAGQVGGGGPTSSVLKVGKDSVLHKVTVTTGATQGDSVEIVSGVKPGEVVATVGGYGLDDGAKVKVARGDEGDKPDADAKKSKKGGD